MFKQILSSAAGAVGDPRNNGFDTAYAFRKLFVVSRTPLTHPCGLARAIHVTQRRSLYEQLPQIVKVFDYPNVLLQGSPTAPTALLKESIR